MFKNGFSSLMFRKKKVTSAVAEDNVTFGLGYRVVRGPDWKWGDQDIHEGYVGTVVEIGGQGHSKGRRNHVRVQWDSGHRHWYRAGHDGKYDLVVFDNAQDGTRHLTVMCDGCKTEGIRGMRWKCCSCYNYDLCTACYGSDTHDLTHPFLRIDNPWSKIHHKVSCRLDSQKVNAMGIFAGSVVCRGADWAWGDQDGGEGQQGRVHAILSSGPNSGRDTAHVVWTNGTSNEYSVGEDGRVDIRCLKPTSGGGYYRSHLPAFGKIEKTIKRKTREFKVGDVVKIDVDKDTLKILQQGHGGYDSFTETHIRKFGRVCAIDKDGDTIVQYAGGVQKTYNPQALCQVLLNGQRVDSTAQETPHNRKCPTDNDAKFTDIDSPCPDTSGPIHVKLQCKICLSREACVTLVPCGHLTSCLECSAAVDHCPVCRSPIDFWIRTFIS